MNAPSSKASSGPVVAWLLTGVAMIIVQVILGGITRLTGSGLSITEWDIITGSLPPFNEQQWLAEFEKYKQTPQFQLVNFDFTLQDFKFIFFWEWFHRFWARWIGIVFIIPFIIFLFRKKFRAEMVKPLLILFLLGALQGAVGWIMVASGLEGNAVYVKPAKLALHFVFALGLLCYTFWFALQLLIPAEQKIKNPGLKKLTWLIIIILLIQLCFGALMAGHKAAPAAPTWPDINGTFIPENLFGSAGGWLDLIENRITIHFFHRSLAYLLCALVIVWTWKAYKIRGTRYFTKTKWLLFCLIFIQALLGILTVLTSLKIVSNQWGVFEWMALLHQLTAMLLLLSLVWMAWLVKSK